MYLRLLLLVALLAARLVAATHTVNSASSLTTLLNSGSVQPGDIINWTNGTYSANQTIAFQGVNGTSSAPITLRAQTPGGVVFTGKTSLRIGGDHLVASGFRFEGTETSSIVQFRSTSNVEANHSRLTDCAIVNPAQDGTNTSKWVQIYGTNNRVDHCTFTGKRSRGALLVVELGSLGATQNANHVIEYNHLTDFPQPAEPDPNEYEGMRIGFSGDQNKPANCLVQYNLFEGIDADPESISNKSSGNRYLYNTFRACASQVVSRHGDNCTFAGNFILGEGKPGAGGIRIVGTGHDIYNNYISGLRTSPTDNGWFTGIGLMSGTAGENGTGYELPEDCLIFHNTIVDCDIPIVVGEGHGGNGRGTAPRNNAFINNLVSSTRGQLITHNGSPQNITYASNIGHGSAIGISVSASEVNPVDPVMAFADGLLRPSATGPAANQAADGFPEADADIDGQARPATGKDIGADEVAGATGGILRRPLTASDVGASFLGGPGDTQPTITTTSLPDATVGTSYSQALAASGGNLPLTWSLTAGTLPAGLSLSSGGVISGTPTATGTSNFTVQVADADNDTDTQALTIVVNAAATVAAPAFSPAAGTYASAQSVTITTATSGATIRFTTDGSTPSQTVGTIYAAPVNIAATTTLKAIAYKSGMTDSPVTTGVYTITGGGSDPEVIPVASPGSTPWDTAGSNGPERLWDGNTANGGNGTRWASNASPGTLASSPRWVSLDLGATYNLTKFVVFPYQSRAYHYEIHVSADGVNWGSPVVNVQHSTGAASYTHTLGTAATGRYVRLLVDGISGSSTTWASINEFDIFGTAATGGQVAAPAFNPGGGTYASAQSVAITSATSGATIRYTTDGSTPSQTVGTIYAAPVNIAATTTLKAIAYKSGMTDSPVTSATYTISGGGSTHRREAESYNSSTGGTFTIKNDAGASGGQFVDFPTASITATYNNLPSSGGSRVVAFRYRNGDATGTNRTMTIALNGGSPVTVTFPGNGNWTSYQTTTATVTFANSSTNTAVLASSNAPDLDYFEYNQ